MTDRRGILRSCLRAHSLEEPFLEGSCSATYYSEFLAKVTFTPIVLLVKQG